MPAKKIFLYDTTLRDGSQAEGVSFSLEDKVRITKKLDDLGVNYIEGGWPGSNPKDVAFFKEARKLNLKNSRIAAFGSTHHPKFTPAKDPNIKLLASSGAPVITLFGKVWDVHVKDVLRISKSHNIDLITASIRYLKPKVDELVFDAEHFFDGYKEDEKYAMQCLKAALEAGADWLVLCDTNGGSLPHEVMEATRRVKKELSCNVGIHCHNDSDLATANTLVSVTAGARHVHGTINGIGERCGNADMCAVVPNLQLKMGYKCLSATNIKKLKDLSGFVSEIANMRPRIHQPYVGRSAFAHKGGVHVDAVLKNRATYEHILPEAVGNRQRILVSDLSGKANITAKAKEFRLNLDTKDPGVRVIVNRIKELEHQGYQYEAADGSLEILMKKATGQWKRKFDVHRARVIVSLSDDPIHQFAEAVVVVGLPGEKGWRRAFSEGNGPVNALDNALRKAVAGYFPELKSVKLLDFKVRLMENEGGTGAKTHVLIESTDENTGEKWGTVGVSENLIEASWQALMDSIDYRLHKKASGKR